MVKYIIVLVIGVLGLPVFYYNSFQEVFIMDNGLSHFLKKYQIDSIQKINVILFLYQFPDLCATCEEFANRLYLGTFIMERLLRDLEKVNLIVCMGQCYRLSTDPEAQEFLRRFAAAYEPPLIRQKIIDGLSLSGHLPSPYYHSGYHH